MITTTVVVQCVLINYPRRDTVRRSIAFPSVNSRVQHNDIQYNNNVLLLFARERPRSKSTLLHRRRHKYAYDIRFRRTPPPPPPLLFVSWRLQTRDARAPRARGDLLITDVITVGRTRVYTAKAYNHPQSDFNTTCRVIISSRCPIIGSAVHFVFFFFFRN